MSKNWAGGSTRAWRKVQQQVLQDNRLNNGGRCRLAIPDKCTGKAEQVHHTLGRAVTGDDPRYLMAVCGPCNRAVGDPTKNKTQASHIRKGWL